MACGHPPPHINIAVPHDSPSLELEKIYYEWLSIYESFKPSSSSQHTYYEALEKSSPKDVRALLVETCYPKEAP